MKILSTAKIRRAVPTLLMILIGFGNSIGAAASAPQPTPSADQPKTVAYRISPADKLSIAVIGEPELNVANKRVDSAGNINLAHIQDVHVAGLTVAEAQTAVETAYKEARILRNPQVSINIEEYSPREVSISGMIKQPGKYSLPPETILTLKDIVLRAGGFQDTANGSKVRISRTNPDGTTRIFVKDIDSVIRSRESKNSADGAFPLEPGDLIYVPEKII